MSTPRPKKYQRTTAEYIEIYSVPGFPVSESTIKRYRSLNAPLDQPERMQVWMIANNTRHHPQGFQIPHEAKFIDLPIKEKPEAQNDSLPVKFLPEAPLSMHDQIQLIKMISSSVEYVNDTKTLTKVWNQEMADAVDLMACDITDLLVDGGWVDASFKWVPKQKEPKSSEA